MGVTIGFSSLCVTGAVGCDREVWGHCSLQHYNHILYILLSCPGAEFTQYLEVTFYPGEEQVHITQTAEGLGADNYLSLRTHIEGQVPFVPESASVHIAPYKELYRYSSSGMSRVSQFFGPAFGFSYVPHLDQPPQSCGCPRELEMALRSLPTLPYPNQPYSALPHPTIPNPTQLYPIQPNPTQPYPALPSPTQPYATNPTHSPTPC